MADGGFGVGVWTAMNLQKDLYVLIVFHFLVNMWMAYGPG
jgi:hypothetical protein